MKDNNADDTRHNRAEKRRMVIQSELQIWSLRISSFSTNCRL
jgi:hypothetical protein